jgi:hypothetical protein
MKRFLKEEKESKRKQARAEASLTILAKNCLVSLP